MRPLRLLFCILLIFTVITAHPQLPALGQWRSHLSYASAIAIAPGIDRLWVASPYSFFSIDQTENSLAVYSKVNGLSQSGISSLAVSADLSTVLLAYTNGDMDIIDRQGTRRLPDFYNSTITGDKTINGIRVAGQQAFLATGLGIVVADLSSARILATYIIGDLGEKIAVKALAITNTSIYAATSTGIKVADRQGSNLSDYRSWVSISGIGTCNDLLIFEEQLLAASGSQLFRFSGSGWELLYSGNLPILQISATPDHILLTESHRITKIDRTGQPVQQLEDAHYTSNPKQALELNGTLWIADSLAGLSRYTGSGFQSYIPNGPAQNPVGQLAWQNQQLWATAGGTTPSGQGTGMAGGLYRFQQQWTDYTSKTVPAFDSLPDCVSIAIDPISGQPWIGSLGGGLFTISPAGALQLYKQTSPLEPSLYSPGSYQVSGLAFDQAANLWIANTGAAANLKLRKANGSWQSFAIPFPLAGNAVSSITIDPFDQKWIISPNGQGLICFNTGISPENTADDRWKWFRSGQGNGNLPANQVNCVAVDKNGLIWIGTAQGIGIIQCPQRVFDNPPCEAILPIVQQDNFAGYLFRDEWVQAIAVDGADRKWIGTRNGLWLISPDGEKTIYRFTSANSPLPSNDIKALSIDEQTGEVFISCSQGLFSFRSTATTGGNRNENVLVFPNPVPPGYEGSIAIRGLVNNAIVKITETNGRLVYQTRALGGQAVWDGKNYRGQRPAPGVYLVLVNNDGKTEKLATKIFLVNK